MKNLIINDPIFLSLVLLIPIIFYFKKRWGRKASIHYPATTQFDELTQSLKIRLQPLLSVLRILVLIILIIALARPQLGLRKERMTQEGIDIILAVDVSTSMLAEDFRVNGERKNRLDIVKKVLDEFIPKRFNDRLGMVVFAGRPYTMAPLTWDQDWLLQRLAELEIGMIEDGTAVGSAIMTSLNRLKDSQAKSKILILLTDGNNNHGEIGPEVAAETARALGIKIYTIGVGSQGLVPYPVQDPFGKTVYRDVVIEIDEKLLIEVADTTGGKYYRATDTEELYQVYEEIDQLEKTEIEMDKYNLYKELYPYLIMIGLFLLSVEIILKNTVMRRLPCNLLIWSILFYSV